jgi:RHS repeat-associated protein
MPMGSRVACEATPSGAQRVNSTLYFDFSDHLGSTSVTVDFDGTIVGNELYKAWGGERYTNGSIQTTFKYTGQRHAAGAHSGAEAGLYFYNARWYDPAVGRFIQADTIIPEPANPLAWDRYAYANNNPLYYTDPSGHKPCDRLGKNGECINGSEDKIKRDTDNSNWWDYASNTEKPNDPTFSDWTKDLTNEWREERASILWSHLCQIRDCPLTRDLAAYLLFQEGSILLDDPKGIELMTKAIKYKLLDGISMSDLAFFTSFINPEHDGRQFSDQDWQALTTKPDDIYFKLVDIWFDDPGYPIIGRNGEVVEHWWVPGEVKAGDCTLYYSAKNASGNTILYFGY